MTWLARSEHSEVMLGSEKCSNSSLAPTETELTGKLSSASWWLLQLSTQCSYVAESTTLET